MIFLLIYLVSALICKGVTKLGFNSNPEMKIKFMESMEGTGISADKMINIICLAPLVNTGLIVVWIYLILDNIFSRK